MSARRPYSILVVEDERIVAQDIQQTLRDLGYDAFAIASSADEAIAVVAERCPDLVLMDIRIKGERDGIQTAQILKQDFGVAVVYLTAHADDKTLERASDTEPFGYLVKPVNSTELRVTVEVSLHKHEMERRLLARERWFATTLHSIADAVVTVDLTGVVTFMNPAAEQLTATTAADGIGRPVDEVVRLAGGHLTRSHLDLALERGTVVHLEEAELSRANAERRTVSDSVAPVIDAGKTVGAVMVFRDITEQKLLQKRLELTDRLASLGTMAAGVAHEVNNPLAVVVGNASFVHDQLAHVVASEHGGNYPAGAISSLREALAAQAEILTSADRIRQIVSELGAFSHPTPTGAAHADVERAIDWALKMTGHELRPRARVLKNITSVPPVALDETRLGQVLINLLVNAAHAISPGDAEHNEVAVSARASENEVVIEVRDSGSGMSPEVQKQIFDPFFTTKSVGEGTGLGLSICHGIATSAGGSLQVESSVNHGSSFRLVLPTASNAQATPSTTARPSPAALALRGRLLVIDDEELVLRTLRRLLHEHEVICVDSANKALRLIESGERFDLILSDMTMPDLTGMDFYEVLRSTHPDVARRIVFLSGGTLDARVGDFLAGVPNPCLQKPFQAQRLKAVVQRLLRASSA